jgi:hypothetical protein
MKRFNITLEWQSTTKPTPKPKTQKFVVDSNTASLATSKAMQWVLDNHGLVGTNINVTSVKEVPVKSATVMLD